jgi:hypothetical protein|tara:strand:+ start:316 stop:849 length:534 start_codon:yes stop_codon:yes gene_type:complete
MVKPILILGGAIPVIIAILIAGLLVTSPEIPIIAIDPDDIVQIEFTKHELIKVSYGMTERFGAKQTEIISIENDGSVKYSLIKDGIPKPEKNSSIDTATKMKLSAMIKETGFLSIPTDSFTIRDDINEFMKFGVKITYNGEVSQLYWPEQNATEKFIPPMMTMIEEELESIMDELRE